MSCYGCHYPDKDEKMCGKNPGIIELHSRIAELERALKNALEDNEQLLRRACRLEDELEGRKPVPVERVELDVPTSLLGEIQNQSERSGRTLLAEIVFLLSAGQKRMATVRKHRGKKKHGVNLP